MSNFLKNIHPLLKRGRKKSGEDTNFAVLNALHTNLSEVEAETIAARAQSFLLSATEDYLDAWGDWFGIYRHAAEPDTDYRTRIVGAVDREVGTVAAIEAGILAFLDDPEVAIDIYEPWQNIFWLNGTSRLNSDDKLMGNIYRYGVIMITINKSYPSQLLEVIKLLKPAGVTAIINLNSNNTSIDYYTGQALAALLEADRTYYID